MFLLIFVVCGCLVLLFWVFLCCFIVALVVFGLCSCVVRVFFVDSEPIMFIKS